MTVPSMCCFFFDLKLLIKAKSFGPNERPSFSGLLMLVTRGCTSWQSFVIFSIANVMRGALFLVFEDQRDHQAHRGRVKQLYQL